MIDSLSAYSPGSLPGFGSAGASTPAAHLQASFPGLTVLGVGQSEGPGAVPPATARPVAAAPGAGLASGQTLLTAQEQGSNAQGEAKAPGQLSEEEKQQV